MFLKNFRVKSNTAIRGSDRRKLRNDVLRELPYITQETVSDIIPNKEDMTVMKIMTHSGQNVTAYTLNGSPIFFQLEQRLYPTVYLLWKYPDMLPAFTTWPNVFERIHGGADLMLPGVILPSNNVDSLMQFHKEDKCSVSLLGNKAPVAIGYTAVSSSEAIEQGMKGKGVIILHSYMDQLWCQGSKCDIPKIGIAPSLDKITETQTNVDHDTIKNSTGGTGCDSSEDRNFSTSNNKVEGVINMSEDDVVCKECENEDKVNDQETSQTPLAVTATLEDATSDTMDSRLERCFLHSLLITKSSDLPILTSTFYKNYMLSFCPPEQALDIKKSSYKKLTKFLQIMENRGYMTMKELSKGVHAIDCVNWENQDLRMFKKENPDLLNENSQIDDETTRPKYQPPEIEEVLAVSAATRPLFKDFGCSKGTILSTKEVRGFVTDYVKSQELSSTENKRNVLLNPVLFSVVHQKGEKNIDSLPWDELFRRVIDRMNPCHKVTFPGRTSVVRKGRLEPIEIKVAQRMGNKKVTLVHNLEYYGVDPGEFAHKLQLKAASSTAVSELPGKGNNAQQVLIQGNQTHHVATTLQDDYQIAKKYICGLEKSKQNNQKKK